MSPVSTSMPTDARLRMVANLICEAAGAVEQVMHDLELSRSERWTEYVEALKAEAEIVEVDELDPAEAWSLHVFANDVRSTAADLTKWAERVDELARVFAPDMDERLTDEQLDEEQRLKSAWLAEAMARLNR